MKTLILFLVIHRLGYFVPDLIVSLHLLEEKKFSKSMYSYFTVIILPIELLAPIVSGFMTRKKPLQVMKMSLIAEVFLFLLYINVFLVYYTEIQEFSVPIFNSLVFFFIFTAKLIMIMKFSDVVGFFMSRADKNISTHITLFATIYNLSSQTQKYYGYRLVDKFGLQIPNFVGLCLQGCLLIIIVPLINKLQNIPIEDWKYKGKYLKVS